MVRVFAILFLVLSAMATAVPGDINSDGIVDFDDVSILAGQWLSDGTADINGDDIVDFVDFAILAAHFGDGCTHAPPVATNVNGGYVGLSSTITLTLTATDGDALTYKITSLPAHGSLKDIDDTAISSVPFTLDGNQVKYTAGAAYLGSDSFGWSATDDVASPCGGTDAATASVICSIPPTATAQSASATAYIWKTITLAGTDDGYPNPPVRLKYIISSLPAVGLLYDPKSGAGEIKNVPYTLSSYGTNVLYATPSTGNSSFGFKATDGGTSPAGGESSAATVSITTAANPLDCLSFDGHGTVSIPDGTYLDVAAGWATDFWIKTRDPFASLIKKRGTGAGYEIKLVSGKLRVELYDSDGTLSASINDYARIDNDEWQEIEVCVYTVSGGWNLFYIILDGFGNTQFYAGTLSDYSNAEPVVIGGQYKGQFDKLRYFSGITDPTGLAFIVQGLSARTSAVEQVVGFGLLSKVMFMCDEHSGTTITDSKTSKVGTFSNADHVAWHPWIVPFVDVSVPQNYYGGN